MSNNSPKDSLKTGIPQEKATSIIDKLDNTSSTTIPNEKKVSNIREDNPLATYGK
jgi:hypothetical protein